MSSGGSYVKNKFVDEEQYSAVAAYSVGNTRTGIPSGATIVEGIYYMWDDGGFTGDGWKYNVVGGPTNTYPDFSSDEDVALYVETNGNLDAVFSYWSAHYNKYGWDAFYRAVNLNCMDVDQSAAN